MNNPPRVMAIHDMSGIGKCSLTVILPILSAMGAEVAALPTAVLSTHTGDIAGYTFRDLTDDMLPMSEHWYALGLTFDALYSGWLGSGRQTALVRSVFARHAHTGVFTVVDPVMGDHGRLYSTYTQERVADMRSLCSGADLITPNLTEACLLLEEPYGGDCLTEAQILRLCARLCDLGASQAVLTGVSTHPGMIGAAAFDGVLSLHETPRIEGKWHGTGDIFCAVLLGSLLRGFPLDVAAATATSFTSSAIVRTRDLGTDPRFGVDFERGLPALMMEVKNDGEQ
ncbi:MAG: pyridoxamine kinase [Clostridia bacterium]|nr:pyridoxamine kinase [Clostridia bacterium]